MIKIIKLFILFYSFHFSFFKLIYIFTENSIFNVIKHSKIIGTTLEIKKSGEYIIKGKCEKANIIINTNYATLYIINSNLNCGLSPLIVVGENKHNIFIYLNEAILSSSFNSGIIQLKQNSNVIINSKFSIIKGGDIIKGEKQSNLIIKGFIGLSDKIKYISLNVNINQDFIFGCENEKIKFDQVYMEINSDTIFNKKEFFNYNLSPFEKNLNEKSFYIYNNEINFNIKIQNIFEKEFMNKENNTFYLNYLYFKHINIAKEKCEEKLLKKLNISFKPKVSVIIPIYNVEKYLITCINSIINQTLKEIEIICVNDGSTDDSLLILLNFSKLDNRIMIIDQRNRGLSEARNTGVKYSNGEFIYFIDSDDILDENALFELYNYGIKNNLDTIYFYFIKFKNMNIFLQNQKTSEKNYLINPKNILEGKDLFAKIRRSKKYNPSACISFYRKKFYIDSRLSFYPGILHEDELFTLTGILLSKRATLINKNYYYYRMHGDSIMHTKNDVKNLYGCLISYYEILRKFNTIKFKRKVKKAINISKKLLRKKIKKIMKNLSKNEKKILSIILSDNQKKLLSEIIKKNFI